ncbi:MAG: MATE family efflux transporter [Proteobacteria bacterium]|nr:MATE family efflux transporter [Pseudomonadota bacterium]
MSALITRMKDILIIAWPLIVANSFWNLQLTIDRIFLGKHSTESLGAAMAVMGVFWVLMALLQQTASYITTFVAQYYGANESHKIGSCFWQAIYVSVVGGLAFIGLNFVSADFFAFVGHAPNVQVLEVEYFNSISYSALPTALVAAISGFYTGLGRTKIIMAINCVGLVLNIILDYAMIFGNLGFPAWGVAGAGYATAIATYGSAIFGLFLVLRPKLDEQFRILQDWRPNLKVCLQFLRFGLPSGMQWALEGLAFTVFLIIMGRMSGGEAALASSSIAVTVMMLSVLPSMGIAQAVMTIVGQKLGQKTPNVAEQAVWDGVRLTSIYMGIVALTFVLIPEFYLSWFENSENQALWSDVSKLVPRLLQIVAVFTLLDSIYLNISFALKGAGDTNFVSIVALLVPWPVMVLPAYLVREMDQAVVIAWWFAALYSLSVVSILVVRFRGGRWKTMSVIQG